MARPRWVGNWFALRGISCVPVLLPRSPSSLVIATGTFPGSPAVTAALAYGVFGIVGSLVLALAWGRPAFAPGGTGQPAEVPESPRPERANTRS